MPRHLATFHFLVGALLTLWSFGALWSAASPGAAWGFAAALSVALWAPRRTGRAWFAPVAGFAAVLVWWLALPPAPDRASSDGFSRQPTANIDGDRLTITPPRRFDDPHGGEPVPRWRSEALRCREHCLAPECRVSCPSSMLPGRCACFF